MGKATSGEKMMKSNKPGRLYLMIFLVTAASTGFAQEESLVFEGLDIAPGTKASAALLPAVLSGGVSPRSVAVGGQITFQVQIANPGAVSRVELVFTDANLSEPMVRYGNDIWRSVRTMSREGSNRPYQIRIVATNGQSIAGGNGVYSVLQATAATPPAPTPTAQPRVQGVSPGAAQINQLASFSVTGSNLPSTLALALQDAECQQISVSSAFAQWRCTPRAAGAKELVVKDRSGGAILYQTPVNVATATPVAPTPLPQVQPQIQIQIQGVSPNVAQLNQLTTFSVTGSNLPSTLAFAVQDAECLPLGISSAFAQWRCTPRAAGVKQLVLKDRSGGTSLYQAQVNVPAAAPVLPQVQPQIQTVSPETAQLNQQMLFTVTGVDLPATLALALQDAECQAASLATTSAQWRCTPRAAGPKELLVKDRSGGNVLRKTTVNVATAVGVSPQISQTQPPSLSVASADPHEMWKNWQEGSARINTPQLRDGKATALSPAEIVFYSSRENNINPVLTLAKLQGEQSLVQGNFTGSELSSRLELATGYGARIGSKWYGFFPQVVGLTYQFDQFAKQGKRFADAYQTYTQDIKGPFSSFQQTYANYALAMNRIAGTNYAANPADSGYYRDFSNLTPQIIQAFMQQMGGVLANGRLFGGSGTISSATITQPGSNAGKSDIIEVTPLSAPVGQDVTFTVTGNNVPSTVVINLSGELCHNDSKPKPNQVVCHVTKSGRNDVLQVKDGPGGVVLQTFAFTGTQTSTPLTSAGKATASPLANLATSQAFGSYLGTYNRIIYNGYHPGTDFRGSSGTPVFSIADGVISKISTVFKDPAAGGWYTVIDHAGMGVQTLYLHTAKPLLAVGTTVRAGQQIAVLTTPTRFPTHLHVEVKKIGKKVVDSNGNLAIFVGKTTTPVGNLGYVRRASDLNDIWLDPLSFIKQGSTSAKAAGVADYPPLDPFSAQGDSIGHVHDEQEDDPPAAAQVSRKGVLDELAKFAVSKKLANAATMQEMQRLAIFQGSTLSRPNDPASRMEMALMAQRLIERASPKLVNAGQRFGIDEFGGTAEATEQDYLGVVNRLFQWGIVVGQQDHLGAWRYYPTRKLSSYELGLFVQRLKETVAEQTGASTALPATLPPTSVPTPPATQEIWTQTAPAPIVDVAAPATPTPFSPPASLPSDVSVGVSNTMPAIGSRVDVNLFGSLSDNSASDIYLYMKQADTGAIYFWHGRQFNDMPKPWRASVVGPNLPETNPIFSFDVKQAGNYAAGVLVVPAGSPFNLATAREQALSVQ